MYDKYAVYLGGNAPKNGLKTIFFDTFLAQKTIHTQEVTGSSPAVSTKTKRSPKGGLFVLLVELGLEQSGGP